jgi:hypothetical protein
MIAMKGREEDGEEKQKEAGEVASFLAAARFGFEIAASLLLAS